MSIPSTGLSREARKGAGLKTHTPVSNIAPLVVKPRVAWLLLQCSNTKGYELIGAGELESFKDGKSRKITVASIHRYIAKRLAEGEGTITSLGSKARRLAAEAPKLNISVPNKTRVAKRVGAVIGSARKSERAKTPKP
jgi:hypothetical protein